MAVDIINSILEDLAAAHAVLEAQPEVAEGERSALTQAREELVGTVESISPALLSKSPENGEWSVLQVLEHVLEHDQKTEEVQTKGLMHYAEHLQEHRGHILKITGSLKT